MTEQDERWKDSLDICPDASGRGYPTIRMSKEEKIRERIHDIIGDCLIKIGCGEGGCPKAERLEAEAQETCIQGLLDYLDSQGVALKVERELPKHRLNNAVLVDGSKRIYELKDERFCFTEEYKINYIRGYSEALRDMLQAGFTACWEPLI